MALQKAWRAPDQKQQHVGLYRKILMRKHMLRFAEPGAAYVPFIGDGDIAVQVYGGRTIYGADLDPERVQVAAGRLPGDIRVGDCDVWPFADITEPFAVADFDAYIEPYKSFRAFWAEAEKLERLVVFFTDGRRQGMMRTSYWTRPDGKQLNLGKDGKYPIYNAYLTRHVWPWFDAFVAPWRVLHKWRYQRDMMIYWAAALEAPKGELP